MEQVGSVRFTPQWVSGVAGKTSLLVTFQLLSKLNSGATDIEMVSDAMLVKARINGELLSFRLQIRDKLKHINADSVSSPLLAIKLTTPAVTLTAALNSFSEVFVSFLSLSLSRTTTPSQQKQSNKSFWFSLNLFW